MKKNIGNADKLLRVLAVIVIAALYFTNVITGTVALILLVFAGILLLTSVVGICPLYIPFGISSKEKEQE